MMDEVRAQYERWIYPQPVDDLETWLEPVYYNPEPVIPDNHQLYRKLESPSDADRWRAMELFGRLRTRHVFCVWRADRPETGYWIDFADRQLPARPVPLRRGSTLTPAAAGRLSYRNLTSRPSPCRRPWRRCSKPSTRHGRSGSAWTRWTLRPHRRNCASTDSGSSGRSGGPDISHFD